MISSGLMGPCGGLRRLVEFVYPSGALVANQHSPLVVKIQSGYLERQVSSIKYKDKYLKSKFPKQYLSR